MSQVDWLAYHLYWHGRKQSAHVKEESSNDLTMDGGSKRNAPTCILRSTRRGGRGIWCYDHGPICSGYVQQSDHKKKKKKSKKSKYGSGEEVIWKISKGRFGHLESK